MSTGFWQRPRTAEYDQSIWRDISEAVFRQGLVALEECTNAVPIAPCTFSTPKESRTNGALHTTAARSLPISVEQSVADDFASIAAVQEGAQSVAAVCLEENATGTGIIVRLAAIDTVNEVFQHVLNRVVAILSTSHVVGVENDSYRIQELFNLIVEQHYERILGRLRSSKWQKPSYLTKSHKKPLFKEFENLIHRVQFMFTKQEHSIRAEAEKQLRLLATRFEDFETVEADGVRELHALKELVKASYQFCTDISARTYADRLSKLPRATAQAAAAIKSLQQIEKIAAYLRIAESLVKVSRQYPTLFQNISVRYINPYSAVPTNIAYESWAETCHVHAEVQLAVYYDSLSSTNTEQDTPRKNESTKTSDADREAAATQNPIELYPPRCIGTSKYLCYLCYLFLKHRNKAIDENGLHIANTHGRLYDQWTIPDLSSFSASQVLAYRRIIRDMHEEIRNLTHEIQTGLAEEQQKRGQGRGNGKKKNKDGGDVKWRAEPMTSRENLLFCDNDEQEETTTLTISQ